MKQFLYVAVVMVAATVMTSCATLTGKSSYHIAIGSSDSDAHVLVKDLRTGKAVNELKVPATIMLQAGAGFFKNAKYELIFTSSDSTDTASYLLNGKVKPSYVVGNFLIGGLIGWVIVDPATGKMWKIEETNIYWNPLGGFNVQKTSTVP